MKRTIWAGGLSAVLGLAGLQARADDATWRPATPASRAPAATLGAPVPRGAATALRDPALTPTAHNPEDPAPPSVVRGQSFDLTSNGPPPVPPPVPPPGPIAPVPNEPYNLGAVSEGPAASPFGFGPCLQRGWFRSDHCFDNFISPVTNPFLFEDPRALTEVRPIFMYQATPAGNFVFRGGDIEFFGVQARLAITDRLSFVMNKLGFIWEEPHNAVDGFAPHVGFSEVWLGPKYTFLRNENSGTLGAVGLTFQIPAGPRKVFQNTGDLSLVPYLSLGQNFWRTSYGSVNALGTLGYSLATDNKRSEYFFLSAHLDYDVANLHKFYPLIELNWTQFTVSGTTTNLGFEGRDLINFGSANIAGNTNLTLATGFRYKFSEAIQMGIGTEWPIVGRRDLMDFRLTADLIFRY